ncbi:hypothetical protein [Pseudomonas sp. 18175]|uniref:hypothetical protein n=1 Tax=Pseudomonas sp. 18175 TaxID=3390056 RepID=UPI003D1B69FA
MKRQILATVLLSVLASSAFALPAAEQATPQNKAQAVQSSQTLARSGSQEEENRDYAKGAVAENGSDRLRGNTVAEDGSDRLRGNTVAEDGSDRLRGNTVAEDGSDRLRGNTVAEDGSDRLRGNLVAEDGSDRLKEQQQAQS